MSTCPKMGRNEWKLTFERRLLKGEKKVPVFRPPRYEAAAAEAARAFGAPLVADLRAKRRAAEACGGYGSGASSDDSRDDEPWAPPDRLE